MKYSIAAVMCVFLFLCMLLAPGAVFEGACSGLLLWFHTVLPTLFPFLAVSNLLLMTGSIRYISDAVGGIFARLFGVSKNGSFCVLAGFLCGYPVGAKMAADLVCEGYISKKEGEYLLSFCNNTSPSFIMNFLVLKTLGRKDLLMPTLAILLLSPVLVSLFTRRIYRRAGSTSFLSSGQTGGYAGNRKRPDPHPESGGHFLKLLDKSIMDSFETLVKIGGYIILFSVLLTLLQKLPIHTSAFTCLLSLLEITNGTVILGGLALSFQIQYPMLLFLNAFGGLCAAAQTQCMIQRAGLPFVPYLIEKLAAALTASLLGTLYLLLF